MVHIIFASFAAASADQELRCKMGQRLNKWQCGGGDRQWLSLLIEAMEEAVRPEVCSQPVEAEILMALRAQLARPVTRLPYAVTPYSLRN